MSGTDPFDSPSTADKGPVFEASYPGRCGDCGDAFDAGDQVQYVDGELLCSPCGEGY